jgi:CRP/FNR family cyclic AMP-dependent transcriptional regulator
MTTASDLSSIPLFAGLAREEIEEIQRRTRLRRYRKNTVIIKAGDESSTLYLLLSGRAEAYVEDEAGRALVVREFAPGDHFGELALLGGTVRTASVLTLTECEARLLPGSAFQPLVRSRPELAVHLIGQLARRLVECTDQVRDLGLLSAYERIRKVLTDSATRVDDRMITPCMSQQDLADRAGCSRETVSRIIRDLRTGGYVVFQEKRFIIQRDLPPRW